MLKWWLFCKFMANLQFSPQKKQKINLNFTFILAWKKKSFAMTIGFHIQDFVKAAVVSIQFKEGLWYPWKRRFWRWELGVQIHRSGLINYHGNRGVRLNEKATSPYTHIYTFSYPDGRSRNKARDVIFCFYASGFAYILLIAVISTVNLFLIVIFPCFFLLPTFLITTSAF